MNSPKRLVSAAAALLSIGLHIEEVNAGATLTITESGGDLVVTGAGTLNTSGLSFSQTLNTGPGINPSASFLEISTGAVDLYGDISGPADFGTGPYTSPSSGSGDRFGIRAGNSQLSVPSGYVSGTPLTGTSTFADMSFADLGLTPGSYTWTWGAAANADSLTINVVKELSPTITIDENKNPVIQWNAELGRTYSISYTTDLEKYFSIVKGFPVGGAQDLVLEYKDLPNFTDSTPKAFYRIKRDSNTRPDTAAELAAFYSSNGGESGFTDNQVKALDTLLFSLDEIEAGQLVSARARIDAMFADYPLSASSWTNGDGYLDLNIGSPPGYYGIRMLDQILTLGNPSRTGTLQMTAVVAPSAMVTRPTLPDLAPETVELDIAPEILAEDARRLHMVTQLFRRWIQAISGGLHVELVVYVMDEGTTVNFTDDGQNILSYPDAAQMIDSVPSNIANATDFWWVIAPSGVPGDGSGYNRHFITGGMGAYGAELPLFLSDDAWFTRKVEHLGSGPYSEIELRMYQPQWFQHEFMHHVYKLWPEFGLEDESHQWFDRTSWPADFVGRWEPDYYAESFTKRIFGASVSVAEALQAPDFADMSVLPLANLLGNYRHDPVENPWHEVNISLEEGNLRWNNNAGVSWGLEILGTELWSEAGSPYGADKLYVQIDENENVIAVYFKGARYGRIPAPTEASAPTLILDGARSFQAPRTIGTVTYPTTDCSAGCTLHKTHKE
jgi:hypothetical protein